jgi:TatA/E family protein of Tat protein translocase
VFALILDSLGGTELIFILAVALIFFGPRKLPQLARSLGKSVAEFRKASEDFKRTWEREVALESSRLEATESFNLDNSSTEPEIANQATETTSEWVDPATPDNVVPRQSQTAQVEPVAQTEKTAAATEPLRKQDWL